MTAFLKKEYDKVLQLCGKEEKRKKMSLELCLIKSMTLRALQNYGEAEKIVNDMKNRFTNSPAVWGEVVLLAKLQNNTVVLGEALQKVFGLPLLTAWDYLEKGLVVIALSNDYRKAVEEYTRAIAMDSSFLLAYLERANAYVFLGNYEQAIEDYTSLLTFDSKDLFLDIYLKRADLYFKQAKYFEASLDYTIVICGGIDGVEIRKRRIACYEKMGKLESALRDYLKLTEIEPKNAVFFHDLGYVYQRLKIFDKALSNYIRSIELNPSFAYSYHGAGVCLHKLGNTNQAFVYLEKAITLDPFLVWSYLERGYLYTELKKYPEAISDFSKVIEINPNLVYPYMARAEIYFILGKYEEAKKDYEAVIKLNVDSYSEEARKKLLAIP